MPYLFILHTERRECKQVWINYIADQGEPFLGEGRSMATFPVEIQREEANLHR